MASGAACQQVGERAGAGAAGEAADGDERTAGPVKRELFAARRARRRAPAREREAIRQGCGCHWLTPIPAPCVRAWRGRRGGARRRARRAVANFLLARHADGVPACAGWREVEGDQPAAHREPITPQRPVESRLTCSAASRSASRPVASRQAPPAGGRSYASSSWPSVSRRPPARCGRYAARPAQERSAPRQPRTGRAAEARRLAAGGLGGARAVGAGRRSLRSVCRLAADEREAGEQHGCRAAGHLSGR